MFRHRLGPEAKNIFILKPILYTVYIHLNEHIQQLEQIIKKKKQVSYFLI